MVKPIPVCQTEGCNTPLFDKPSFHYDGRRKYCPECAKERQYKQKAFYAWKKRLEERGYKTYLKEQVKILEIENDELKEKNKDLLNEVLTYRLSQ